jgi:hypothetical protein
MKYEQWLTNPIRFKAMTGYTVEAFQALLPYFEQVHDRYLTTHQLNGKPRSGLRKFVLYANSPLASVAERLAFILSYYKLNPLQEQHADTFGLQQQQCNLFLHGLKVILDQSLALAQVVPAQTEKALQTKLAAIQVNEPDNEASKTLLHDGAEREIPRPQDPAQQQENYSGKKKKHTRKNALIINSLCLVLFVSATVAGKIHDKKIADTSYSIPKGFTLWQDTGYQGYKPEGVLIQQPRKKPRGKELTTQQKQDNQQISRFRVRIEHPIGSIKRYRIVKRGRPADECRLRKNEFVENIFLTCAALHNFRLRLKPFNYEIKAT